MLTIDDPEIERLIQAEATRTGEAPAEVVRRALLRAQSPEVIQVRPHDSEALEGVVVRNGIRLFPYRPDEPPVTSELVRSLLEGSE